MSTLEQVERWLQQREDEHVEFKEAKNSFSFDELVEYCAAIANEGGGHVVLGISPKLPRHVVGSHAFRDLPGTVEGLYSKLRVLRVYAEDVPHPAGRVVAFSVPPRPLGVPIAVNGRYPTRVGGSLTAMGDGQLKKIFSEATPDFSATTCAGATFDDLETSAIEDFRERWARKAQKPSLANVPLRPLLADAELIDGEKITYAALVLFGKRAAIGRFLPQSEVIFEFRSGEASGPAQQRLDFRSGLFTFYDELWRAVAARNEVQHFQDGLFVSDIPTFDERPVRELLLNAVAHRDYQLPASVFVRQYPRRLEVISPGGLPAGVTIENILTKSAPRNRRISNVLQLCGLVERSGQGMNLVYESCVRGSRQLPDFRGTDDYQVSVTLSGVVQDVRFVAMLEQVGRTTLEQFTTDHFLALDLVHREQKVPPAQEPALRTLVEQGLIERVRRGKYVLSRRVHAALGQKGAYTRKAGLDRDTNKQLLLKHIRDNVREGSRMEELMEVLPDLTRYQVSTLLRELKAGGLAHPRGQTRAARWYPGGRVV